MKLKKYIENDEFLCLCLTAEVKHEHMVSLPIIITKSDYHSSILVLVSAL